uniref:Uncharacterized protein n=1 Tax=Cucumis melo TaxID=3656 RepID=A0A9I9E4T0_CUCME
MKLLQTETTLTLTWKKACFKGASIFEDVLEIGVLEESLYLQELQSSRNFIEFKSDNIADVAY